MSLVVASTDADGVDAAIEGVTARIPRSLANADYQRLLDFSMKKIELTRGVYNAFPSALVSVGSSLAAIFSSGTGHGVSQRQIGIRSDDQFATFARSVFLENAGLVYNNGLLDGMLATGDVAPLKNVFKVRKTAGGYENSIQSTINVSGATYAFWAAAPVATGGKLYCTGYRTSPAPTQTALFESSDGGWTWSFTAVIAADASKAYSEAAIVKATNGDFVAVIREDTGVGRPLYISRCTAGVVSWSAPTLLTGMEGVQPCLLRLPDGSILLLVGHRTGGTGLDLSGQLNEPMLANITGVACWRSTDHGVTWSNRVILAPMWSTDGGQPMAVVLDGTGKVGFLCYLAPGSTSSDYGVEPGIYWVTFQGTSIA